MRSLLPLNQAFDAIIDLDRHIKVTSPQHFFTLLNEFKTQNQNVNCLILMR